MRRFFCYYILFLVLVIGLFFVCEKQVSADEKSEEAIVMKIIPNPEHLSPVRWYREQGFEGSPSEMVVDGYRAIRDGRSVYVGAANVEEGVMHTNIYLISFNQEASSGTTRVANRILENWRFNTNIRETASCNKNVSIVCLHDTDCPVGDHCKSEKAAIIRDVRRLEDIADIEKGLDNYRKRNDKYPLMRAGTYLPNKTISTWPSWGEVFEREIRIGRVVDPINKLGDCGEDRFNSVTCWDEKLNEFADSNVMNAGIDLPGGSRVYVYSVSVDGSSYDVCAVMESGYVKGVGSGDCGSAKGISIESGDGNSQPVFLTSKMKVAFEGMEYEGLVEARDADGDDLSWGMTALPVSQWNSWSGLPVLYDGESKNQKIIGVDKVGEAGFYNVQIMIDDGRGAPNSRTIKYFTIKAINPPPKIYASNANFVASSTLILNYKLRVEDSLDSYPLIYSLDGDLPNGVSSSFVRRDGSYFFELDGILNPTVNIIEDVIKYDYHIRVTDKYGSYVDSDFVIDIKNNKPKIKKVFDVEVVVGSDKYEVKPIVFEAFDDEGNELSLSLLEALPFGMKGEDLGNGRFVISGVPNLEISGEVIYPNVFEVVDEYGAKASSEFFVRVVNNVPEVKVRDVHMKVGGSDLVDEALRIEVSDLDGHEFEIFIEGELPSGLSGVQVSNDVFQISGVPKRDIVNTQNFALKARVRDEYGAEVEKEFMISLENNVPDVDDIYCDKVVRVNNPYSCVISATDIDGHGMRTFELIEGTYPEGLVISDAGLISGVPINAGEYLVGVRAVDEFGYRSEGRNFSLVVNNFCGDGKRELPNMERSGGLENSGMEQCDGQDNIAKLPSESSMDKEYACTDFCEFSGGYCGDGIVNGPESCECGDGLNECIIESCDGKYEGGTFCSNCEIVDRGCECKNLKLDLVFVLDNTGSMGGVISVLKNSVVSIAEILEYVGISARVALVTYNDPVVAETLVGFTGDAGDLEMALSEVVAHGGGDEPEVAYDGLMYAAKELEWRNQGNIKKKVILITDAKSKEGEYGKEAVSEAYRENDIELIGVFASELEEFYKDMISEIGGEFFGFSDSDQIREIIMKALLCSNYKQKK